jgi:outer membrane lipoprotein-sorting protein
MSKNFLKLFCISLLLLLASCAPRATAPVLFEEKGLAEVMAGFSGISRIDTTFSVIFEKADSEIYGDGALNISVNGDLEMKVYTLGFLALELSSRNGIVKSNPGLDSTKKTMLTQGLRDSIFWWDIKDFTVREEDGFYLLMNTEREIMLDKKSGLPARQRIYFSNGKVLTVHYENPAREEGGVLYQSKMKIELSKYAVTLMVKDIHFIM